MPTPTDRSTANRLAENSADSTLPHRDSSANRLAEDSADSTLAHRDSSANRSPGSTPSPALNSTDCITRSQFLRRASPQDGDDDSSDKRLAELDALLSAPLAARDCQRICQLARSFPGRLRRVITSLSQVRQSAGVDALCSLKASEAGVLEGLCHAFRLGCTREIDGHKAPELLALEFRHSRARAFPALVAHAEAAFPEQLQRLTLGRERWFRLVLRATPNRRALRLLLREHGDDLVYLHRHLSRLRRTRLWINGWCFESSRWTCAKQVYLVQAWIEHASQAPAS
ncbi:MAG TPA: hypothetical protein ENK31_04610 [Nannocystis exedens]|nr:hypothetical protein [Nannocystis exedens]